MCLGNWIEPSASAILIWNSSPIKIWLWAIKLKVSLSRSFEEIKTFQLTSWEKNPDWRSANWPILIQKAPFVNLTFSIHAYQTLDEPMKKKCGFWIIWPKDKSVDWDFDGRYPEGFCLEGNLVWNSKGRKPKFTLWLLSIDKLLLQGSICYVWIFRNSRE